MEMESPAAIATSQTEEPLRGFTPNPPLEELPRCWICQQDPTEDTPETSVWRRPCPCSLTAHDECLLEWITSQEAPAPGEMATAQNIVCPVCKAPIKLDRPQDLLVTLADLIQKTAKTMIVPTAASALLGTLFSGLYVYGFNAMNIFFGAAEARKMMMPSAREIRFIKSVAKSKFWAAFFKSIAFTDPFLPVTPIPRLLAGLPLIAPALIFFRTTLADPLFATLPVLYFATHPTRRLDLKSWPPSPALTLAVLPYIRTTYNRLYAHTFSDLEKQWDKAVLRKPRPGETAEQIAGERQAGGFLDIEVEVVEQEFEQPNDADGDIGLGENDIPEPLELDADAEDMLRRLDGVEGNALDELRETLQRMRELREQAGVAQAEVRAARRAAQRAIGDRAVNRRNQNGWEIRQNVSTTHVASTVMGALFFPTLSSMMGRLLLLTLPTSWVTKRSSRWGGKVSEGLLKETWGRNLIGGCIFVVLKDAVTLYCKWKKARDFGKKKILDYMPEEKGWNLWPCSWALVFGERAGR